MRRALFSAAIAGVLISGSFATRAIAQDDPNPEDPQQVADVAEDEAEHETEHHHMSFVDVIAYDNYAFWGAVVNFLLFALFVVTLAEKPLASFLATRRNEVREGLAEAKRLKDQAEATRLEYETRLKNLDVELAQVKDEMIKAGEAERDRIVAEAETKAHRMRKDAEFVIDQQIKQLRIDLAREAAEASVEAARTLLLEATMPSDQQRLAQDYLARLGKTRPS